MISHYSEKMFKVKIYLHFMKDVSMSGEQIKKSCPTYSPTVYHILSILEKMKNKVITDQVIVLHRLLRHWKYLFFLILIF